MIVDNIRYGFATNSSSTHSLAIWKGLGPIPTEPEPDTFGWDWFTANTADSKGAYLRSLFMADASRVVGGESAAHMASLLWGVDRERLAVEFREVSVDHDSDPYLPRTWDGKFPHMDFTMEFNRMLQNPRIAILGGNDNEDDPGAFSSGYATLDRMGGLFGGYDHGVARRDPTYGHWTIFNRVNGKKIRIRLDETLSSNAERSTIPELVDLSLTDACSFGCPMCYRGSTPEGKHADTFVVQETLRALGELQVFEVAFGGGEPTLHSDFVKILETARYNNVVPNFTTRNLAWLRDEKVRDKIIAAMGAFAYSVDTPDDIRRVDEATKGIKPLRDYDSRKVTVQYVVGQDVEENALRDILMAAAEVRIPITLLGYKTTGRGAAFGEKPCPRWVDIIDEVRKSKYVQVGIDTVLADRGRERLIEKGLDPVCLAPTEGTFSCYIDAVTKKMHRSSYDHSEGVDISASKTDRFTVEDGEGQKERSYTYDTIDFDTVMAAWEKVRLP